MFGIAARLNPVKDVATLIRGFALAAKEHPNIRLLIAGDGEEREMLESWRQSSARRGAMCLPGG